jgi:hypothetical protein
MIYKATSGGIADDCGSQGAIGVSGNGMEGYLILGVHI